MPSAVCFLLLLPLLALLPKPGSCSCGDAFQLQCHSSDHCVWIWEICDGINDCEDNSDEEEGLCRAWKTNECAAHRARCTRHGGSRCLPISLYCLSKDPPCKGTLDRRVCVMVKDNKLKPLHETTLPTTTTTTTPPPPTMLLPSTKQSRQEMEEEMAEHFRHKLSLTISHPDCPKLYTRVGSLCLSVFFMSTMDWLEARTFCRTIGGHLLTLGQDAAAYATLLQHLAASGVTEDFWVGGRRYSETGWQWLDDTPVQMGSPYWAVRHEAHCRPRTLPDLDNQTTLANDGACYLYQQAPPRSTHRHCLAATFRHYWHLSDEDCGDKKSPLCVRPEERKEEKQAI